MLVGLLSVTEFSITYLEAKESWFQGWLYLMMSLSSLTVLKLFLTWVYFTPYPKLGLAKPLDIQVVRKVMWIFLPLFQILSAGESLRIETLFTICDFGRNLLEIWTDLGWKFDFIWVVGFVIQFLTKNLNSELELRSCTCQNVMSFLCWHLSLVFVISLHIILLYYRKELLVRFDGENVFF